MLCVPDYGCFDIELWCGVQGQQHQQQPTTTCAVEGTRVQRSLVRQPCMELQVAPAM